MRRSKNSTIYTGRVGAKMGPRPVPRPSKRIARKTYTCQDGPFARERIRLDPTSDLRTLPIVVRGHVGHYQGGTWVPFVASV